MKKQIIRFFAILLVCATLFSLTSCNSSFGTITKVTTSLLSNGYKIKQFVPVVLIPAVIKEQMMAMSDTDTNVDIEVDVDIQTLHWFLIVVSEENRDGYLICIFEDDASANVFWEQMTKVVFQAFNSPKDGHVCEILIDSETGMVYCPNCEMNPDFKVKKNENTISIIGFDKQSATEVTACAIVREGNIVYIGI